MFSISLEGYLVYHWTIEYYTNTDPVLHGES